MLTSPNCQDNKVLDEKIILGVENKFISLKNIKDAQS